MKPKKLLLFAFRLAVIAALACVTTLPLAGQGGRQQIQGTWFGTGTSACLVAAPGSGFNPNLTPTDGVSLQLSSVQGTLNINADGTGTGEFHEFVFTPLTPVTPSTYPPASGVSGSSNKNSISFTYTIADDGTLTVVFSSRACFDFVSSAETRTGALCRHRSGVGETPVSWVSVVEGNAMKRGDLGRFSCFSS